MSSNAASSSSRQNLTTTTSSRPAAHTSHLESVITRLLVQTKQLLEGLAKWSRGEISEDAISQIYVKLGNDFNVACAAFDRENIGMSELLSVPADLRVCLETCLSDTPSQATLEKHLPGVRQIIIGLLTGLREKQKLYREGVALRKTKDLQEREAAARREVATSTSASGTSMVRTNSITRSSIASAGASSSPDLNRLTPASTGRSRDQLRKFVTQTQSSSGPGASQSLPNTRTSTPVIPTSSYYPPPSSPPPPPPPPPPPSTIPPSPPKSINRPTSDLPVPVTTTRNVSSSSTPLSITPKVSSRRTPSISEIPSTAPTIITSRSTNSIRDSNRSSRSTDDTESFVSLPSLPSSTSLAATLGNFSPQRTNSVNRNRRSSPPPPPREVDDRGPVPTTPTDFQNMGAFPFPLPVIARSPSIKIFEDPFSPTLEGSQDAAQLRSLENLKSSDNLSRRASKRFSAYAIQKITTGTSPGRNGDSITGTSQRVNGSSESGSSAGKELSGLEEKRLYGNMKKKSEFRPGKGLDSEGRVIPPLPTSTSYEGDLRAPVATIKEEREHSPPRWSTTPSIPLSESSNQFGSPARSFTSSLPTERPSPASTISAMPHSVSPSPFSRQTRQQPSEDLELDPVYPLSVYLQIGKDVKKAKLDTKPTVASLRVHFIERFQYNPGQSDFPSIYLRDPVIGIQYELEDMGEIRNGSVLSLNIDSVEQVKIHFDQGLASVSQELKDLRATVMSHRRASIPTFSPQSMSLLSPPISSPSERQFQDAAKNVLKSNSRQNSVTDASAFDLVPPTIIRTPSVIAKAATTTTKEIKPVVNVLKSQHSEVQNLRRELGVLRQVYVDFADTTKGVFATMRAQTSHVRNLGATKIPASRAFIVAGKAKLEADSEELIVRGNDLQDAVDEMRKDILNRKIRPRPAQVSEIVSNIKSVTASKNELLSWIATVKPSWKATWSLELETIISEQQFLEDQEATLVDLEEDIKDSEAVLQNIQQVAVRSKVGSRPAREFVPIPLEDQAGLSTVLLEVRGLNPDANKRLEAIEKTEKARELNLATKKDDFADELGGFVSGNRLKKSGGIEEAERLRELRSQQTLKNMFSP